MLTDRADLHVHTNRSDGTNSPADVVRIAADVGLGAVGITDHDSMAGIAEALEAADGLAVTVVPGVEVNAREGPFEVHVLGYFIDLEAQEFQDLLYRLRSGRVERAKAILARLASLGIHLDFEELVSSTGEAQSLGRPHIASLLCAQGHATTPKDAFRQLLRKGAPAYVEPFTVTPGEATEAIRGSGGAPVFAHPGIVGLDHLIDELTQVGLAGIEVAHPQHKPAMEEKYRRMAQERGLLMTGGSDCHGERGLGTTRIGEVTCDMAVVEQLQAAAQDGRAVEGEG